MFKEGLCGAGEALRALEQVEVVRLQPPPAAFPAGLSSHAAPPSTPAAPSVFPHTSFKGARGLRAVIHHRDVCSEAAAPGGSDVEERLTLCVIGLTTETAFLFPFWERI